MSTEKLKDVHLKEIASLLVCSLLSNIDKNIFNDVDLTIHEQSRVLAHVEGISKTILKSDPAYGSLKKIVEVVKHKYFPPKPIKKPKPGDPIIDNYVNITQYADLMNVSRRRVYEKINEGAIVLEKIGKDGLIELIDYNKYKDIKFTRKGEK